MNAIRGGVKLGRDIWWCWNIGWPFARLHVTPQALEIRVRLFHVVKTYRFNPSEITIEPLNTAFSRGIVIRHSKTQLPPYIAFEVMPPGRVSQLHQTLKEQGYTFTTV